MTNTKTIQYPVRPLASIDDDAIVQQMPANVMHQLGELQETGYHLIKSRRDLFFDRGDIQYVLGARSATVHLD